MRIKKIKVTNFKSFDELEVELNDFNIVIGANASGKSNFVHIFEFLRDIVDHGLENAISMQGDSEFLRNVNIGGDRSFSVEVTVDNTNDFSALLNIIDGCEMVYRFALEFQNGKPGFKITEDKLFIKIDFERQNQKKGTKETGELIITNNKGEVKREDHNLPKAVSDDEYSLMLRIIRTRLTLDFEKLKGEELLLETSYFKSPFDFPDVFLSVPVYNFDPRLAKKAIPITGMAELEEDGSNLAIVLRSIMHDEYSKKQFLNLINDVLPFVEGLDVQKFADRFLQVHLKEIYSKNKLMPAFLLSDGTLNITALIIALYFSKKPLLIIEEPERNILPHLISKIVEIMREVSAKKQIIVTTHNPEIIKHARLEDLLFIARDQEGFSQVSRPAEKEKVKIFLENEIGIDELYIQDLLEL